MEHGIRSELRAISECARRARHDVRVVRHHVPDRLRASAGQFMKYFGEDRIVFGSDSPWYGGPQWQIEALWRFDIPDDIARLYGYPKLTEAAKRKILGLNSARMYKLNATGHTIDTGVGDGNKYRSFPENYVELIPNSLKTLLEFPGYTADNFSKARLAYQSWNGAQPRNTRLGWIRNAG